MADRLTYSVPPAPMPGSAEEWAELRETLHRAGVLRVLKDFFGKLGAISDVALGEINTPPGRDILGAALFLWTSLSKLPVDDLKGLASGLAEGVHRAAEAEKHKPPGTLSLLHLLQEQETRRALNALLLILNSIGAAAARSQT